MKANITILLLISFIFLNAYNFIKAAGDLGVESESAEIAPANTEDNSSLPLFDENSITKLYLNKYNGLQWTNKGGDWVDLNGTAQGNVPWASVDVNRKTQGPIMLDVTTLASAQRGKNDQLMVLSATVSVQVWSRESVNSPTLKVTLLDGSSLEVSPVLDCFISLSTVKSLNLDYLKFDAKSERAFMQFKLPNKEYKSVILNLWPGKIYGSGQIQAFNLAPQSAMFNAKAGIAQGLSSYDALKGHPEVIFVDTFDGSRIKPEWSMQGRPGDPRPEKLNNGVLSGVIAREHASPKNHSGINLRFFFAKNIEEEPTEIYFRYSVRFHEDILFATQGGKLPGQAGTYNRCGWGGRKPSRTCEAWSARMKWSLPIKTGPYKGLIPIGTYLYHMGQKIDYGEPLMWQSFCHVGQWCELEQHVKLNTPGQYNGILRGYHNGELVYKREDIRYRDSENVRIEDAWTLVYHGGMGLPTKPIHVDLDNVVIAKKYIGLLEETESAQQNNREETSLVESTEMTSSSRYGPPNLLFPSGGVSLGSDIGSSSAGGQPKLKAIQPGVALDLGVYSCANRVPDGIKISCEKVTDYSRLNYDPYNHRLIMFGGGHSASGRTDIDIFDIATFKWASLYPSMTCNEVSKGSIDPRGFHVATGHPAARHTYDMNVIADLKGEGRFMMFGYEGFAGFCHKYPSPIRAVAHYPLNPDASDGSLWSYGQLFDGRPPWGYADQAEFDPISGMVIIVGRKGLWVYDPAQHKIITWVKNNKRTGVDNYDGNLVYFPPNQRMYWFSRSTRDSKSARVFELILDRAVWQNSILSQMKTSGVAPVHRRATGFAYGPLHKRIGGAVLNGVFHRFDPVGKRWSSHRIKVQSDEVTEIDNSVSHALDYDRVNDVYMFISRGASPMKQRTWAYRDAP